MEGDSTNIVQEAATQMDEGIKSVMPATWIGHARLTLDGKDLSDEQRQKVLDHTESIAQKKNMPAEKVALKVMEKLGY